jgi:hypothetical protein
MIDMADIAPHHQTVEKIRLMSGPSLSDCGTKKDHPDGAGAVERSLPS